MKCSMNTVHLCLVWHKPRWPPLRRPRILQFSSVFGTDDASNKICIYCICLAFSQLLYTLWKILLWMCPFHFVVLQHVLKATLFFIYACALRSVCFGDPLAFEHFLLILNLWIWSHLAAIKFEKWFWMLDAK